MQVTLAGETKPSHEGTINFLDNRLDVSTGTLRSRAVVKNTDLSILPGQFGRVRMIGSAPYEALLIPDVAVATDQSRKIVFVVKPDQTVEMRNVVVTRTAAAETVIASGIEPGETVVTDGQLRLVPGSRISVKGQAADSTRAGD